MIIYSINWSKQQVKHRQLFETIRQAKMEMEIIWPWSFPWNVNPTWFIRDGIPRLTFKFAFEQNLTKKPFVFLQPFQNLDLDLNLCSADRTPATDTNKKSGIFSEINDNRFNAIKRWTRSRNSILLEAVQYLMSPAEEIKETVALYTKFQVSLNFYACLLQ